MQAATAQAVVLFALFVQADAPQAAIEKAAALSAVFVQAAEMQAVARIVLSAAALRIAVLIILPFVQAASQIHPSYPAMSRTT